MKETLKKRGWTDAEIDKTVRIITEAKKNKHPAIRFLDSAVYWIALIVTIIGNLIIAIVLIPFLFTLKTAYLYLIIIIIGFSFGLLFELLIRSMTHLKTHHHVFFGLIIPCIAVINIFIITNISKKIGGMIGIQNTHSPFIVSVVYAAAFILPYIIYHLFVKE